MFEQTVKWNGRRDFLSCFRGITQYIIFAFLFSFLSDSGILIEFFKLGWYNPGIIN